MKKVEIESLKLFGERMYKLLGGPFKTRREAENFVKTKTFRKHFYYRIVYGTNERWYVYGSPTHRKYEKKERR